MKIAKTVMLALTVLAVGCRKNAPAPPAHRLALEVETVIGYLAMPDWAGEEFDRQVLGDGVRFEAYDPGEKLVYFSLTDLSLTDEKCDAALRKFLKDSTQIEWAKPKQEGSALVLGKLEVPPGTKVFRSGDENFKIEPGLQLHFPYKRADYALSVAELAAFSHGTILYGGKAEALARPPINGRLEVFVNHGPFVAKPGEPTLARLTAAIISPVKDGSREDRVQTLLDFVSTEIDYDFEQLAWEAQKIERPCEVLMRRKTICGNKSVLFASLLEQTGIEYRLVYFPRHLTVAVECGKFPTENGYTFFFEDKDWVIAEPTCSGFQIGKTMVNQPLTSDRITYVQTPSRVNDVYDVKNGRQVKFLPQ